MLYPLKFKPVFKDYLWGGRELAALGKNIPEGIVAESWEISCHQDGVSTVANGEFSGILLTDLINKFQVDILGTNQLNNRSLKFPLLIKFIDANDKLSVQVHPNDEFANIHENGEYGKNEMWYILSSKPGAKLVYGTKAGVTKEVFASAVKNDKIGECLNEVEVKPGDILNIPSGLIHAIGEGILLAEIQQNSNTTYRVYDYNRIDKDGNKRPLHIEKALEVIDFNRNIDSPKVKGLEVSINTASTKAYKIANKYFSVEEYVIKDEVKETTDGSKFFIYVFVDGNGEIHYDGSKLEVSKGETVLIPAAMGEYCISGNLKALKAYVPDIEKDIVEPLKDAGYTDEEIYLNVEGLRQ
jgi:mannose-6-phosphate isomerase